MCNRKAFYKNWNHPEKYNHGSHPGRRYWREKFRAALGYPPVNVKEKDNEYVLYAYAPGLKKEDFLIATIDNTLSISVEKKMDTETKWRRQEFTHQNFKRQFELNEKVDKTTISAKYENGVLIITLPKLEGFETARQNIEIA